MSQLQQTTRPIPFIRAPEGTPILVAMVITAAIMLALTAAVAFTRAPVDVSAPTLGPTDDYFFRHREAAAPLGTMDDYWFRQQPAPITLTDQDDYWFRQQHAAVGLGPLDDYGTRHRGE